MYRKNASELDNVNIEKHHNELNKFHEVAKKDKDLYIPDTQVLSKSNKKEDEKKYKQIILVITKPNFYLFNLVIMLRILVGRPLQHCFSNNFLHLNKYSIAQ